MTLFTFAGLVILLGISAFNKWAIDTFLYHKDNMEILFLFIWGGAVISFTVFTVCIWLIYILIVLFG